MLGGDPGPVLAPRDRLGQSPRPDQHVALTALHEEHQRFFETHASPAV